MPSVAWNGSRAIKHLLSCPSFQLEFQADYESLLAVRVSEAARSAEASRRSRDSLLQTSTTQFRMTQTSKYKWDERIDRFSRITPEKKAKLDRQFANAIINDGDAFTTGSSENWAPFWKCAFGGSWRPPFHDKISGELLDIPYASTKKMVIECLSNVPALSISAADFPISTPNLSFTSWLVRPSHSSGERSDWKGRKRVRQT